MAERRIKKDITYIDPSKKGALLLSKNRKIQLTRLKPKNADDGFNILIRSTLGDVTKPAVEHKVLKGKVRQSQITISSEAMAEIVNMYHILTEKSDSITLTWKEKQS